MKDSFFNNGIYPFRLLPPWILMGLEGIPQGIQDAKKIHGDVYKSLIPKLPETYRTTAEDIQLYLIKDGLHPDVAGLVSEYFPCAYLKECIRLPQRPRLKDQKHEVCMIQKAARDLERSLLAASKETIRDLRSRLHSSWGNRITPEKAASTANTMPRASVNHHIKRADLLFFNGFEDPKKDPFLADEGANDEFTSALNELAVVAKSYSSLIPKDPGGSVSGYHDREASQAKEDLAFDSRMILKILGDNYGSQPDGPVSTLIWLVHMAATGEPASFADRYAEMTPRMQMGIDEQGQ
jgi:hypothetical protein